MHISPVATHWHIPVKPEAASVACLQALHVKPPHFYLHFDMNKTLIGSDRVGKKNLHDVVCAEISAQVTDCWDDSITTPISYADYIKHYLLPNPNNSAEIKDQQKEKKSKILELLKERNHPQLNKMTQKYQQSIDTMQKQTNQVFRSFYRLIEFLKANGISFTLFIRTFGSESTEVAKELNEYFGENFITDLRTLKEGHLNGADENLYELITHADHNIIIRDDWKWWASHGQDWHYGKPFPVDPKDKSHISLFFDDNAVPDLFAPNENIVFPYDANSGEPISPTELIAKEQLIPVDMLQALCDENYYVRFIEKKL